MGLFRQLFFPPEPPTAPQQEASRHALITEGAVAAVLYSVGTGNFLAGYLSQLGATLSFCAFVAMIPQLGCVLQFASPFLFERIHHRKLSIWLLCVIYRVSLAAVFLVPLAVPGHARARWVVLALYTLSFFAAGLVTPGLSHLTLGLAPDGRRGAFFARKDIAAVCVNSAATLVLGRVLDALTRAGRPETGYLLIGAVCAALALLDAMLLLLVRENPVPFASRVRPADILRPVRDRSYRPLLLYAIVGGLPGGLSTPFLSVYELRVLGLSHSFITTVGVVSAVAGMAGSWYWGRLADRAGWRRVILLTAAVSLSCTVGWALVRPAWAPWTAPLLMVATTACSSGSSIATMNLQFAASPATAKTTYISVTSATASIAACLAASLGTALQPLLETAWGNASIPCLFGAAGLLGFVNLAVNGRKLPNTKT